MRRCTRQAIFAGIAISIFSSHTPAQQTPCDAKHTNSSKIGPDGTAYVTRMYNELLKTYKPNHIDVYGTSAGAILTAEDQRTCGDPLSR
jgi:hypothetical protein